MLLYAKVFKTYEGARKRAAFERAHATGRRNVNFRFFVVRCKPDGTPDGDAFNAATRYTYRIERTLLNHPTDPRILR